MAQFRGTLIGRRGSESTKLGDRVSGLEAKCEGWNSGVMVEAKVNDKGQDGFYVYATEGTSKTSRRFLGLVDHEGKFSYQDVKKEV